MPLASTPSVLKERKATMPAKLCPAKAARKLAGTETRPFRSTLFTNVDRNSAKKNAPNARPEGRFRSVGSAPSVPRRAALRVHGLKWDNMGIYGRQWNSIVKQ